MLKFETLYNKARKGYDSRNREHHVIIYLAFMKSIFPGCRDINVMSPWHVKKNAYNPHHQGGESIKSICYKKYYEALNNQ